MIRPRAGATSQHFPRQRFPRFLPRSTSVFTHRGLLTATRPTLRRLLTAHADLRRHAERFVPFSARFLRRMETSALTQSFEVRASDGSLQVAVRAASSAQARRIS